MSPIDLRARGQRGWWIVLVLVSLAVTVSEILARKKTKTTTTTHHATIVSLQIPAKLLDASDFRVILAVYFTKIRSASPQLIPASPGVSCHQTPEEQPSPIRSRLRHLGAFVRAAG